MTNPKDITVKSRKVQKQKSTDRNEVQDNNENDYGPEINPPIHRYGPLPNVKNLRLWTRFVIILGSLAVVYFTSSNERILAKQKEVLEHRKQHVPCSTTYKKDINKYPGCAPLKCGRAIMDKLISSHEADSMLDIAKRAFSLGGSAGGASILDLHSGALSLGENFVNIYKTNISVLTSKDFHVYRNVKNKVVEAVAHSFGISSDVLHLTQPTFFSRLTSDPPVTPHDEYWHPHVDAETYKSFHYTSLLYLNNYGAEYKGGRFLFIEEDNSTLVIEPRRGRVSIFTSGKENRHYVERVKSGVRYAVTISFTCDKALAAKEPSFHSKDPSEPKQPETKTQHTHTEL